MYTYKVIILLNIVLKDENFFSAPRSKLFSHIVSKVYNENNIRNFWISQLKYIYIYIDDNFNRRNEW